MKPVWVFAIIFGAIGAGVGLALWLASEPAEPEPGAPGYVEPRVVIRVAYPGATPEEVERGVVMAIEESVSGLRGVTRVTSESRPGVGVVTVHATSTSDVGQLLREVFDAVERIHSFPEAAERPVIAQVAARHAARVLYAFAMATSAEQLDRIYEERLRPAILGVPGVELLRACDFRPSVSVELGADRLRSYGLTLAEIGRALERGTLPPGGSVRAPGGEVLVRTAERRGGWIEELGSLVVREGPGGAPVLMRDLATIHEQYEEADCGCRSDVGNTVCVELSAQGEETLAAVDRALANVAQSLPPGLSVRRERAPLVQLVGVGWGAEPRSDLEQLVELAYRQLGEGPILVTERLDAVAPTVTAWGASDRDDVLQPLPGVHVLPARGPKLVAILTGPEPRDLADVAREIVKRSRRLPDVQASRIVGDEAQPAVDVRVDRPKAARLGVDAREVAAALRREIVFQRGPDEVRVRIALTPEDDFRMLETLTIRAADGRQVPLSQVASLEVDERPSRVLRQDLRRVVEVHIYGPEDVHGAWQTSIQGGLKLPPGARLTWETQ